MFLHKKQQRSSSSGEEQTAAPSSRNEQDGDQKQQEEINYGTVIMDEFGNLVDENGKIIQSRKTVITTKFNQKRKQKKENTLKIEKPPNIKKQDFFDPTLNAPKADRKKRGRGLAFHEKGEFIEKGKMMRELR